MKFLRKIILVFTILLSAVLLVSCKNNQKKFDEAYQKVAPIGVNLEKPVRGNFKLITTGEHEVKISWKSDNEKLLKVDTELDKEGFQTAIIFKPEFVEGEKEKEVTLTATITLGSITKDKPFKIKIGFMNPDVKAYTLEQLFKFAEDNKIDQIKGNECILKDVTVVGTGDKVFLVADDQGRAIQVYCGTKTNIPTNAKIGYKGDLSNVIIEDYYGTLQIGTINGTVPSFAVESEGAKLPETTKITPKEFYDALQATSGKSEEVAKISNDSNKFKKYIELTGIIKQNTKSSNNKYKIILVDKEEQTKFVAINYHYEDNYNLLCQFIDKEVTIIGVATDIRSEDKEFGNIPNARIGVTDVKSQSLTDDLKAEFDLGELENTKKYDKDGKFNFITKGTKYNTEFTYEYADKANKSNNLINLNTGEIKIPSSGEVVVEVKVTAKLNAATKEKNIKFILGIKEGGWSPKEFYSKNPENGTAVEVAGIVSAISKSPGKNGEYSIFIVDKDNTIGLNIRVNNKEVKVDDYKVGDEILVSGKADEYSELKQVKVALAKDITKKSEGNKITAKVVTTFDELLALNKDNNYAQVIEIKIPGLKIKEKTNSDKKLVVTDGNKEIDLFGDVNKLFEDESYKAEKEITSVIGLVDVYKGVTQVKIFNASDVVLK